MPSANLLLIDFAQKINPIIRNTRELPRQIQMWAAILAIELLWLGDLPPLQ